MDKEDKAAGKAPSRDPNKPKRFKTAFVLFCQQQRDSIRESHITLPGGQGRAGSSGL